MDHIFPQASLTKAKLLSQGVSEWAVEAYLKGKDRLSNLQLLPYLDNIEKSDQAFECWLSGRSPTFTYEHSIPDDKELYQADRLLDFLKARDMLLRKRYADILGFSSYPVASEESSDALECSDSLEAEISGK